MTQNQLKYETCLTVTSAECCQCGHLVFMSTDFATRRHRDHRSWYCLSCGQAQGWTGESDIQKLQKELAAERERKMAALDEANRMRAEADEAKRASERLRKRAHAGVCPCCKRSFENVRRHIKTKHPNVALTKATSS